MLSAFLKFPYEMAEKSWWIRWTFTPKHRCEVVLKRMAEAIEC